MKKFLVGALALATVQNLVAQDHQAEAQDTSWKKEYRGSYTIVNDLVHTKVDVNFDYNKSYMNGKVWITLKPHFYPTDSLELDAKGMDIRKVALVKGTATSPLKYDYDGQNIRIQLDKTYKNGENYTIFIDYTAKPNEVKVKGSAAITDAKGLYFINPKGEEKDKPTQIWTQGETEATSVWVPTIDKPNMKTTQETIMTVPAKYVTLSNGKLISSKKNADGTRTDHWKMDLPHAPYLFFMGIGDYAVIKDTWKGKEVSYYVEHEYASVARKIFGNTPEMMTFFSKITGVDYPWAKYAQMTARDYVSGAMENTTATLHQESAQQDARELIDGNAWESTIAHELFHHWFGDYVTAESWSNLTVNESFANYSETLWDEYKYGKDAGDAQNFNDMMGYLNSGSEKKDLVRFHYPDKEAMFDAVSYNKGGRILHMLRNYVGNDAFNKALNIYLTENKFQAAEAHNLRLAFEKVTGQDLNWFFNQWYFGDGHPLLDIDYLYNDNAKTVSVIIKQTQKTGKVFTLPIAIDVYNGAKKERYKVWVKNQTDTFTFKYNTRPELVNVDGDKILLAVKKDNKTLDNYIHQYKNAGLFLDRREAIDFALKNQDNSKALELLKQALKDKFFGLRMMTVSRLDMKNATVKSAVEPILADIAKNDAKSVVRAAAIEMLENYDNAAYNAIYSKGINDSSYSVAGASLEALLKRDNAAALAAAKKIAAGGKLKGAMTGSITKVLAQSGDESAFNLVATTFDNMPLSEAKFNLLPTFCEYLGKISNTADFKKGVDAVISFREVLKPYGYDQVVNNFLTNATIKAKEAKMATAADKSVYKEQIEYVKSKLGAQKGF